MPYTTVGPTVGYVEVEGVDRAIVPHLHPVTVVRNTVVFVRIDTCRSSPDFINS